MGILIGHSLMTVSYFKITKRGSETSRCFQARQPKGIEDSDAKCGASMPPVSMCLWLHTAQNVDWHWIKKYSQEKVSKSFLDVDNTVGN